MLTTIDDDEIETDIIDDRKTKNETINSNKILLGVDDQVICFGLEQNI